MNDPIEILERVLQKVIPVHGGMEQFTDWFGQQKDMKVRSQSSCIYRLLRSLSDMEDGNGQSSWYDTAGHLRQVILMFQRYIQVHEDIAAPLREIASYFGLSIDYANEVNAINCYPDWFQHAKHLEDIYRLKKRRSTVPQTGDGFLYEMANYTHYLSTEQKILIQGVFNMREGQTLLGCLPTGGGKSLIGQLPAFVETRGGTVHGAVSGAGSTIVIVPTVALAIDQYESSKKIFKNAIDEEHSPQAYYGGMSEEKKQLICNGVRNGTIPLLYTSPEAVLSGRLHHALMEGARNGRINRLVIDEVHIVVDWGSAFRTDFQFLSILQRKLLKASGGRLKTVLLSATLTDEAVVILKTLFKNQAGFSEIRSDALRFEPMYFMDCPKDEWERQNRIVEVLPLLPRPIILYVTSRAKAAFWEEYIKTNGFLSVTSFTGDTGDTEREIILEKWNKDEIDMIVATSAFGMGVDKPDIRTIIHLCLPESVNRFYQEVGRGGRDGFASISLLSTVLKEDEKEARSLTKTSVLTDENMVSRWREIRNKPLEYIAGDVFWTNTDLRPKHLQYEDTGKPNAFWNEVTLLFMFRNHFIDILDIRKNQDEKRRSLLIKMCNLELLENTEKLKGKMEEFRDKERQRYNRDINTMVDLVKNREEECISDTLVEVYQYASEACGGCPSCHTKNSDIFQDKTNTEINSNHLLMKGVKVSGNVDQYLGLYQELLVHVQSGILQDLSSVVSLMKEFIFSGIQTIILPEKATTNIKFILEELPGKNTGFYQLLTYTELKEYSGSYLLHGALAIFYPEEKSELEWIYKWMKNYQNYAKENRVIHVSSRDAFIPSEMKAFKECIDGNTCSYNQMISDEMEEDNDWL